MIDFEKLQTILTLYKNSFRKHWEENDEGYKWRAVKCFQDNWNIDADDFADMFERATEKAGNLLTSARNFPRGMIKEFAKVDTKATRSMFRTLFDESQDLAYRVENFRKSSDEMQIKFGNGKWKNHYQNTNAISIYLWLQYPDKYYIYKFSECKSIATQLGSDYQPKADGSVSSMIGGYRMYDEICEELEKDKDLQKKLQDALTPECYPDPNLKTLAVDLGHYVSTYYPHEQNIDADRDNSGGNNNSQPNKKYWLLSWNPSRWNWEEYDQLCTDTISDHTFIRRWSCTNTNPKIGDEVFLIKLGHDKPRGIIGHGTVHRESYRDDHYDETKAAEGQKINRIDVEFDCLLNYKNEKILLQDDLKEKCSSQTWAPQSSGIEIKAEVIPTLQNLWKTVTNERFYEDLAGWEPSIDVYSPGFTVEQWLELLNDKDIIGPIWGGALAKFYTEPNGTSCKMLGKKYNVSSQSILARINQLAQHIHDKTKCPLYQGKYWPILFVGRKPKLGEEGTFIWKLRPELFEAMSKTDILKYLENTETNITEEDPASMTDNSLFSKNMILYGPPGTGKTYNTVIYAVAICEARPVRDIQAEAEENYQDVLSRFNNLKAEGRIAFTTFHQSYGYEEFIEGIRPVTDEDQNSGSLEYEISDGIFKKLCITAQTPEVPEINHNAAIWYVVLKSPAENDLKSECFRDGEIRFEGKEEPDKEFAWAYERLMKMKQGDFVISHGGRSMIVDGIGIIESDTPYYDDTKTSYKWTHKVKWLLKNVSINIKSINDGRYLPNFSPSYIKHMKLSDLLRIVEENGGVSYKSNKKPYVFIIDEINRGNISKIFGELITLIEDTKRTGAPQAMDAKLPYSGESFSVPQNVYILGTMNTADRSIALMDTALRRRFDFEEMMPDTDILKGTVVVGKKQEEDVTVEIDRMLEKINQRIEILYDREHMIGHAYFIKLKEYPTMENLQEIFLTRIIPLLQEYFYDDYEKIQLVLGDNDKSLDNADRFIVDEEIRYRDFFRGKAENDEFDGKKIYRINKEAFSNPTSYMKIYE